MADRTPRRCSTSPATAAFRHLRAARAPCRCRSCSGPTPTVHARGCPVAASRASCGLVERIRPFSAPSLTSDHRSHRHAGRHLQSPWSSAFTDARSRPTPPVAKFPPATRASCARSDRSRTTVAARTLAPMLLEHAGGIERAHCTWSQPRLRLLRHAPHSCCPNHRPAPPPRSRGRGCARHSAPAATRPAAATSARNANCSSAKVSHFARCRSGTAPVRGPAQQRDKPMATSPAMPPAAGTAATAASRARTPARRCGMPRPNAPAATQAW